MRFIILICIIIHSICSRHILKEKSGGVSIAGVENRLTLEGRIKLTAINKGRINLGVLMES